jgi:hypothetical protein
MKRKTHVLNLENLESRAMMYADINLLGGVLNINADVGDNVVVSNSLGSTIVSSTKNGTTEQTRFNPNQIRQIVFRGSEVSDTFRNLTSFVDSIFGNGGNDWLWGGGSASTIRGGLGNDRIFGNLGVDHLFGDDGNDTMEGGSGADSLEGGAGNDVLKGYSGNDFLYGQNGNDRLYAGSGSDKLWGGTGDDTLVSIDSDSNDTLYGESGVDSFWIDREGWWIFTTHDDVRDESAFEASHNLHAVASFANSADKTLDGDDLRDPTDGTHYKNFGDRPLFANSGPTERDVNQGSLGDCWLMAGLGAAARANANSIRQTVVDFGDGTYGVELGGKFYRVDGDLPTVSAKSTTLRYAGLGEQNSIWVPIVEKAYAFYRRGPGTYASLEGGSPGTVFDAIGDSGALGKSFSKGADALNHIASELAKGKAVVVNIESPSNGCPCIGGHSYIVERVNYQTFWLPGTSLTFSIPVSVVLRNPWGVDGAGNDGADDGRVTVTGNQLVASMYDGNFDIQSAWVA